MKVSKAQAAENRAALVAIASRHLREGGFEAMAASEVAKEASLTHGALYSHFKSKEALASEALSEAFRQCHADFSGLDAPGWLERYLSIEHRDMPEVGCPMAALVSQVPHESAPIQNNFAEGAEAFVALTRKAFGDGQEPCGGRDRPLFMVAAMIGGLALSRALKGADPAMADAVLSAVKLELEAH